MIPLQSLAERWPQINALLDEALALPPAQQSAWLAGLQGEQAGLRDTLERLLAARAQAESADFLKTLPRLTPPAAPGPEAGSTVGPYRLLALLGRGGMGEVWQAERADGQLKRPVALKLPRMAWDAAITQRLARERDILASLAHPNIARLYDAGVDEGGRPYLAMELVAGEPIDAWCAARGASVGQRVGLLLQVAQAVAHAHARLVVHRDLKPSNILVTAEGQVRLLDFGIAKLIEGEAGEATELTRAAGAAMTLAYASPEQVQGEALSTATDVYSLGVVAYELLTGTRPYRPRLGTAAALAQAIAEDEVPLASSAAATPALRKALRGDLDAILNQALRKQPAGRYPTAEALAADLQRHLRREPVLARPDAFGYRSWRWLQRHRWQAGALATAVLGLVAGTVLALWQASLARGEARRASAEVERQEAVRNLYLDAMTRLVVMARDEPAALVRPGAVNDVLREELEAGSQRTAAVPGAVQAQLEAVALQLNYASDFEGSLAIGRRYLDHLKAHGAEPAVVINAHNLLGRTLFQLRRLPESEAMRRAGLAWAPAADDERSAQARVRIAVDLGGMLVGRGRRAEAATVLAQADRLTAERFPRGLLRAQVLQRLSVFHSQFDDPQALRSAQQAHDLVQAAATVDEEQREFALFTLANGWLGAGEPARAVPLLRAELALNIKLHGLTDRNTVRSTGRLAGALARTGAHDEARRLLEEASARQPPPTPGAPIAANGLTLRGRMIELAWLRGDLAAARELMVPDPADYARQLSLRGGDLMLGFEVRALILAGRAQDALLRVRRLRQAWPDAQVLPSIAWLRILETQALAELEAGEATAALATTGQLLSLFDGDATGHSWMRRTAHELAAQAAQRVGDAAAATQQLARADAVLAAAPSPVERADAQLRRAEVLLALGRAAEARAAAQAAGPDLAHQAADSPRLAMARRLGGNADLSTRPRPSSP